MELRERGETLSVPHTACQYLVVTGLYKIYIYACPGYHWTLWGCWSQGRYRCIRKKWWSWPSWQRWQKWSEWWTRSCWQPWSTGLYSSLIVPPQGSVVSFFIHREIKVLLVASDFRAFLDLRDQVVILVLMELLGRKAQKGSKDLGETQATLDIL